MLCGRIDWIVWERRVNMWLTQKGGTKKEKTKNAAETAGQRARKEKHMKKNTMNTINNTIETAMSRANAVATAIQPAMSRANAGPTAIRIKAGFGMAANRENFIDPKNCKEGLIELLYLVALDSGVFDEGSALLGIGAFEEFFEDQKVAIAYTNKTIRELIEATGKKFQGAEYGETEVSETDLAPDPLLSEEEYEADLVSFLAAATAVDLAADWDLVLPGEAYEMRLTYAEALAYNSGANRWRAWLLNRMGLKVDAEDAAEFLDAAMEYFEKHEIAHFNDIRSDLEEAEKFEEWLEEQE